MMAPYLPRLLCLCLAAFFVIHATVGLLVALAGPAAVRAAQRARPRVAARFLLAMRLLPPALGWFVVAVLCVPSYLWLEPETSAEAVGPGCLLAAVLATSLWTVSIARGVRAATRSVRHARGCERLGRRTTLNIVHPGSTVPVWILDAASPLLALTGVFRSRLLISRPVVIALSPEQLSAALRHEEAHHVSRDNLKRLLLLLSPGLLPGFHGFESLERGWSRVGEWAADDDAVAGDPQLSLALAGALVRIARLAGSPSPSPVWASFLGDGGELSARVDRLLSPTPAAPEQPRHGVFLVAALALAGGCMAFMLHPATLESAHRLLEEMIH
jgi:Zn-dependent protease with chaperone function